MKNIVLILLTILSLSLSAQDSNNLYGKINYTFVPHNMLNGVGYTVGYHWNTNRPISYKVEMATLTNFRERKINEAFVNIRYTDLYYNLAQMNLAIIPTWHFLTTKQLELTAGLGLSCAYQSKIFTLSHYEYNAKSSYEYWEKVMNVDASYGLYAGLVGAFDVNYQLSEKWFMILSSQYQLYYKGESLLTAGLGVGYRF